MSITAKALAAKLGLSESAVSLALNDKPGVSRATRRRVIEAAREYGFDFSKKAVATVGKRGTICFAIYKKSGAVVGDTPFFSALWAVPSGTIFRAMSGLSARCWV